jgi:hypothetical protein
MNSYVYYCPEIDDLTVESVRHPGRELHAFVESKDYYFRYDVLVYYPIGWLYR